MKNFENFRSFDYIYIYIYICMYIYDAIPDAPNP